MAKLAGSSPAAAAPTLAKIGWDDLAARAGALGAPAKTAVLFDQLSRFARSGEKVLVFTAFRHTLDQRARYLATAGIPAVIYHGSLPRADKERTIAAFRDEASVLLSTESAGEGRNLQFCHVMVNMDLPGNPMQIEQRLGRLHRVGQAHEVLLTNLVASGTIEEHVLRVLEAKAPRRAVASGPGDPRRAGRFGWLRRGARGWPVSGSGQLARISSTWRSQTLPGPVRVSSNPTCSASAGT